MSNIARKRLLKRLREVPHLVAVQVQGLLDCERSEALRRLQDLVDEGIAEVHTVDGVRTYRLTREWKDKLK